MTVEDLRPGRTIRRATSQVVADAGWMPAASVLENTAIMWLHQAGWRPATPSGAGPPGTSSRGTVAQQFSIGRYRLDFAWPDIKVALEVDGAQHRGPEQAVSDAFRDAFLRGKGWLVFRVDDINVNRLSGLENMKRQLARVDQCVRLLQKEEGDAPTLRRTNRSDWRTSFLKTRHLSKLLKSAKRSERRSLSRRRRTKRRTPRRGS